MVRASDGRPDDTTMRAYRAPFEPPASRRPMHVFPRHILRSGRWLADIERNLETFTGPPRSSGRRTISRSGRRNSKSGAGCCRGHGSPKSRTADTTFGKTPSTRPWRRSKRISRSLSSLRLSSAPGGESYSLMVCAGRQPNDSAIYNRWRPDRPFPFRGPPR